MFLFSPSFLSYTVKKESIFQRLSLSDGLMLSLTCKLALPQDLINQFHISGLSLSLPFTALSHVHLKAISIFTILAMDPVSPSLQILRVYMKVL